MYTIFGVYCMDKVRNSNFLEFRTCIPALSFCGEENLFTEVRNKIKSRFRTRPARERTAKRAISFCG